MLLVLFKRFLRKTVPTDTVEANTKEPLLKNTKTKPSLTPEQTVLQIQQGDALLRERFIASYKPYIAKVTSRFCKRYVNASRDDEYSVALIAFNEAISQFSPESGKSFLGFAETVIRRRLIDYVRREQRHLSSVPYSTFERLDDEEQLYNPVELKQALAAYELNSTADERRLEMGEFNQELLKYGVSFAELVEASPKHADSRKMLMRTAAILAEDAAMFGQLKLTGKLPVKALTEASGLSRKTIERNRKYMIAIACILRGTYPFLRDYLDLDDWQREASKEAE